MVKKKAPTPKTSVYIGPSKLGVIAHGTVYPCSHTQAIAVHAKDAIARYPLIAKLIVDGDTLAADRLRIKQAGNLLHVHCEKLRKQMQD